MICDIANPLQTGVKQIDLDLDVNKEMEKDQIDLYTRVMTSSINLNSNNINLLTLKLKREADIKIYGESLQAQTNYYGDNSGNNSKLTHLYKIERFGSSSLKKLTLTIQVPYKYRTEDKHFTFLELHHPIDVFFLGESHDCKTNENNDVNKNQILQVNDEEIVNTTLFLACNSSRVTCYKITCNFGPYNSQTNPASIFINMMVNTSILADIAKKMDKVVISTNGEVTIDVPKNFIQNGNLPDSVNISSVFNSSALEIIAVSSWIIILSVIMGLLLLIVLIIVFIKIGFFRRTKKKELEELKAAVHHQDNEKNHMQDLEVLEEQEDKEKEYQEEEDQEEKDQSMDELDLTTQVQINSSKEILL